MLQNSQGDTEQLFTLGNVEGLQKHFENGVFCEEK